MRQTGGMKTIAIASTRLLLLLPSSEKNKNNLELKTQTLHYILKLGKFEVFFFFFFFVVTKLGFIVLSH